MKAILQAFVEVPEIDPQPLMSNPVDFSLDELRALYTAIQAVRRAGIRPGPNLLKAESSLAFVIHAMQKWSEEHGESTPLAPGLVVPRSRL